MSEDHDLYRRLASISDAEKEALVDAVYAAEHPSEEQLDLFLAIMLGGICGDKQALTTSGGINPYERTK